MPYATRWQEQHALARAWERYRLRLRASDLRDIARQIAEGRWRALKGGQWLGDYRGVLVRVAVDPKTFTVSSFLPLQPRSRETG